MKELFHKFSCKASNLLGNSYTFLIALASVIIWAVVGPMFKFSEEWQLVINTSTTIITFLSVFLIQNTQNREARAMQIKLDELIRAIKEARDEVIDVENDSEEELEKIGQEFSKLHHTKEEKRNNTEES